ncbi:MAG: ATP-grasp domain-containing protein, partial [Actinobacteria bacterium]|nr:ATP-grasp domain-containing protein [Actinomycetota bacterium]
MENPAPCSSDALVGGAGAVWHSRSRPVVGIVGAGQLARMIHQAAISLSIDTLVLTTNETDPAVLAGAHRHGGSPSNLEDLRALANLCDVVTFDHELVDMTHIQKLEAEGYVVRPGAEASRLATDKLHAHQVLSYGIGVPVPAFSKASSAEQIIDFAQVHGWPVVVKSCTRGYDGKGVRVIASASAAHQLVESLQHGLDPAAHDSIEPMLIVEEYIRFSRGDPRY